MRKLLAFLFLIGLAQAASAGIVVTGSSGSITPGTTVVTGATNCLVYADATSLARCNAWLTANDSGAGTPVFTFTKTMSGASATSNLLNITGTFPATLSAAAKGVLIAPTFVTQNQQQIGFSVEVTASGGTSTTPPAAAYFSNPQAVTGTVFLGDFGTSTVGHGIFVKHGGGSGNNRGIAIHGYGLTTSGDNVGVLGEAEPSSSGEGIGVWGNSNNGSSGFSVGVFASNSTTGTFPSITSSAALIADNTNQAVDILIARDNGTVVASVADGGAFITGSSATAANAISIQETAGQITFEGATSDTIQTRLVVTDPTASDKTITFPNLTGTVALMGVPQTGPLIFDAAINKNSGICGGTSCSTSYASFVTANTTLTPDSGSISSGTLSESVHFVSSPDTNYDFNNGPCGTSACANPTLIGHSANQDTQEYWALSHDGTAGVLQAANSTQKSGEIKFGRTVALTEAGGAETVITITTATTQSFGLELSYQVRASDATPDYAIREGSLKLVCVNNATTVTCTKDATAETDDGSVLINTNAKTLTYAIAIDVATANVAKITFNIDSDMTVTAAEITWTAILNGSGIIS